MTDPVPYGDDLFTSQLELPQLKQRTLRGSTITLAAQAIKSLSQLCSLVVLARLLLPSDFGLLAMVGPVIAFIQVLSDIGLGQAIIQRNQIDAPRVSILFWIGTAVTIGITAIVVLLAPVVATLYREPKLTNLMIGLALLIPISGLSICPNALLARKMKFGTIAKIDVSTTLIGVTTSILFASFRMGYWSLVAGQFSAAVAAAVFFWRACAWFPSRVSVNRLPFHDLRFGGNLTLSNLATFISTTTDNIIVGLTSGAAALGSYDRSYRLVVQPLNQILAPIGRISVPLLSRLNGLDMKYQSAYLFMLKAILFTSLPGMLVCISSGDAVVSVFLGQKWSDAGSIFSWICVGGLASGIFTSLSWIFISQGRTNEMMRYMFGAAGINVLSFVIGAHWGIVGIAAVSASMFVLIVTPLFTYGATRAGPVSLPLFVMAILPFVLCGVAAYSAVLLVHRECELNDWAELLSSTVVSYGAFSAVLTAFPSGRSFLRLTHALVRDEYRIQYN